ncbi:hypothetical protein MRX96_006004 [Rhipicephalus microplus]
MPGYRPDIEPPGDVLMLEAVEYPPHHISALNECSRRSYRPHVDPCLHILAARLSSVHLSGGGEFVF